MLKLFRNESLLKKLSNNKKDSIQKFRINYKLKNDYSQFIPTPILCINTIEDISDKCIIEILKRMDCNDILNMRLVNKRINQIIRRHYNELNLRKTKELVLVGFGKNKCYRLSKNFYSLSFEEQKNFNVLMKNVSKQLRYITITETISMESLNFSHSCYNILRHLCEGSILELSLIDCVISMNFEMFSSLIRTLHTSKVVIKRCTLDDCQLLSDHLFTSNLQLEKFTFYGINKKVDCIYAPLLSNKTLTTWAASTSWPEIVLLQGVKSNFTHNGIEVLLEAFHNYSCRILGSNIKNDTMKNLHSLYWDFGFIRCQLSQLTTIIKKYNRWIRYIKRDLQQISFVYRYSNKILPLFFNVCIYT